MNLERGGYLSGNRFSSNERLEAGKATVQDGGGGRWNRLGPDKEGFRRAQRNIERNILASRFMHHSQ